MRKTIRHFLNKKGYEIIKQPYIGDKYPNLSADANEYYCKTPIGNFHVPAQFEKDAVARMLVRGKIFEPEIIEVAKRYIRPGTAVLDIGANFGQMSIEFSKLVGSKGKIYSFEAQNFVFNFLKKNVEENAGNNVELIERAVYNKDNITMYFSQLDIDCGAPFSGNSVNNNDNNGTPVKTITIDSLNIQEPVSFMKVDIEGADIFALQGAKQTILKNRMPLVFEFSQHMQDTFDTKFNDYVEFATSINYRFEEIILGINYLMLPEEYNSGTNS